MRIKNININTEQYRIRTFISCFYYDGGIIKALFIKLLGWRQVCADGMQGQWRNDNYVCTVPEIRFVLSPRLMKLSSKCTLNNVYYARNSCFYGFFILYIVWFRMFKKDFNTLSGKLYTKVICHGLYIVMLIWFL